MKKILIIVFGSFLMISCQEQQQRYFSESAEIKTLESGISAYESADWENWKSHFADTAKIYVNSTVGMTVGERMNSLDELTAAWENYGFDKSDDHIEMVLDKNDETWVYYWGTHKGSVKGSSKNLEIPVHLAVQFADGKIVAEHVYYDTAPINAVVAEVQAAAEAAAATAEEEGTE